MAQQRKRRKTQAAPKPEPVGSPGVRRVDLRDLIPKGTIMTMPDGKEATLPPIGSDEMAEMLLLEELLSGDSGDTREMLDRMRQVNLGLNEYLQKHNPGLPGYSFPFQALPGILSEILTSGSGQILTVADAVRDAISGSGASPEEVLDAAQRLAEEHLGRKEGEDRPLVSAKPSRTRSSRSATTAAGGRNGGSAPRGRSRKRTSSKSAASKKT